MSGPELKFKQRVATALFALGWRIQFHEDRIEKYIADVSWSANYVDGWFEVKYCSKLPSTLDALDHWTTGQENWLIERGRAGSGHCYLLLGSPKCHALWPWHALKDVRSMPFKTALRHASVHTLTFPDFVNGIHGRCRIR